MSDRQDLILYLASVHASAIKSGLPLGFCRIPMRLTSLRDWVYDYRVVFDHFFEVVQLGFNVADSDINDISVVIPRKLAQAPVQRKLVYAPTRPQKGAGFTTSKVLIRQENKDSILSKLSMSGRHDLTAPVEWLLEHKEIDFQFARAGKLQLRDTSVYPIQAIETWPAWLREDIFGPGIDIEAAYTQFLIEHLEKAFQERPHLPRLLYPDLFNSIDNKVAWRREICCEVLGLDLTEENINIVKKICMSLANGSRISPALMTAGISITRDIILKEIPDHSPANLKRIGERLSAISKQYSSARRVVCSMELGLNPSRTNQKLVFSSYFEWERRARYAIWEEIGRRGIMVHDGIDGVPAEHIKNLSSIIKKLNLRLT